MFTTKSLTGYEVNFSNFNIGGTDLVFNGGESQSLIFDPSLPYIYMPLIDFNVLSLKINKLFGYFLDFETAL